MSGDVQPLRRFILDGSSFDDIAGFYDAVTASLGINRSWGRNLDAFNDILRGGFGTPDEGFVLIWTNSTASAERLGWDATARYWQRKAELAKHGSPQHRAMQTRSEAASRHEGQTLFDLLIEIIQDHAPGGPQSGIVRLVLPDHN